MNPHNFFAELKRRNVIRMAGLYLLGAWLLHSSGKHSAPNVRRPRVASPSHSRFAGDRFFPR